MGAMQHAAAVLLSPTSVGVCEMVCLGSLSICMIVLSRALQAVLVFCARILCFVMECEQGRWCGGANMCV